MLLNAFWYGQTEMKPANISSRSGRAGTKGVTEGGRNIWKQNWRKENPY